MRLSLTTDVIDGVCAGCMAPGAVVVFGVVTETHEGDVEGLCLTCLGRNSRKSEVPMRPLVTGPAPRRKALKKGKKTSLKQELEIAEALGGRTQPGSGNQAGAKGDVRKKGELRVEAKFTCNDSFSLKLDELYKIASECSPGEKPLFVIDYLEPGTRKLRDRYAVVPFHHLEELRHAAGKHR
jgi:hypothetical protein